MKIVWALLEKMEIFIFFLMWTTLNFKGRLKTKNNNKKKKAGDICKGTQDVECERDWSVGLGATLSNV